MEVEYTISNSSSINFCKWSFFCYYVSVDFSQETKKQMRNLFIDSIFYNH